MRTVDVSSRNALASPPPAAAAAAAELPAEEAVTAMVCIRTLSVSSGWPTKHSATPATAPAVKRLRPVHSPSRHVDGCGDGDRDSDGASSGCCCARTVAVSVRGRLKASTALGASGRRQLLVLLPVVVVVVVQACSFDVIVHNGDPLVAAPSVDAGDPDPSGGTSRAAILLRRQVLWRVGGVINVVSAQDSFC